MELSKKYTKKTLGTGHLHARKIPKNLGVKERGEGICSKRAEFTVYSVLFNQAKRLIYCCLVLRFLANLSPLAVARTKKLDGNLHVVEVMG